MAAPHHLLQSHLSVQVCLCLDSRELGAAELAGCDRAAALAAWRALLALAEGSLAGEAWLLRQRLALPEHPKEALRELRRWLRGLAEVPEGWAPCVQRLALERLRAQPRPSPRPRAGGGRRRDGEMQHYAGPAAEGGEEAGERQPPGPLLPPRLATVPLSLGLDGEEGWVVGVRLSSRALSLVGDGCLLAVDFCGTMNGWNVATALLFAPASGRCFVKFEGGADGLMAQALPALEGLPAHEECEHVEAFAHLSAAGGVSFYRRYGVEDLECTGELEKEFLPSWATRRSASLSFQVDQLEEALDVSVSWAGRGLPPGPGGPAPQLEFDATWCPCSW